MCRRVGGDTNLLSDFLEWATFDEAIEYDMVFRWCGVGSSGPT